MLYFPIKSDPILTRKQKKTFLLLSGYPLKLTNQEQLILNAYIWI